jgi:electron transport complex protein RnfB
MNILVAVLVLGGLGALFGWLLAVSSKVFAGMEDEPLKSLTELLPGANCGGCGFTGCADYAKSMMDGSASVGACPVAKEDTAEKMAEFTGMSRRNNQ